MTGAAEAQKVGEHLKMPATSCGSAEELCARYADRVYQFAAMVARDEVEADDLAQTALERAVRAFRTYDPARGVIDGWLWRIVVNVAKDAGRAARRRHLLLQRLSALRQVPPPPDDIPTGISDQALISAVRRLSPLQRSVVGLRFGADLEFREVGLALGISTAAARVCAHRALSSLRTALKGSGHQG